MKDRCCVCCLDFWLMVLMGWEYICNKFKDGTCKYGNEKWWLKHTYNTIIEENGNEKVIQGILKMMEKMTKLIFQMEMDSKNKKSETVENETNVLNEWQIQLNKWMKKRQQDDSPKQGTKWLVNKLCLQYCTELEINYYYYYY
jgi:hypothetical protein